MKKIILYPATVVATGFTYGLLECLLALAFKPAGVNPIGNIGVSLLHRCLFYTVLSAAIGAGVLSAVAAVNAIRRKRNTAEYDRAGRVSDAEAQEAINQLNGKEVDGRALTVNLARPREEGGRRPGGNGGRGGYNKRW